MVRRVQEACVDVDGHRPGGGRDAAALETACLRAGVLKSGVRAFELMVAGLFTEESLLAACGLSATGNWDEMKMDLNKMLTDGTSLVPKGQVARWETYLKTQPANEIPGQSRGAQVVGMCVFRQADFFFYS